MDKTINECAREKYWSEKNDSEKALMLGEALDSLCRRVVELEGHMFDLVQHSHDKDGELVVPLKREQYEAPYWLRNPLRREPK